MGKKPRHVVESSESEEEEQEVMPAPAIELEEEDDEMEEDSDDAIAAQDEGEHKNFGQKSINEEELITERLGEIQKNFYNRLESAKLIKKQGRVPFTEHMTITSKDLVQIPDQLAAVHDDIKRELAFFNVTRSNVMAGMQVLVQANVPISRPDDFLAEMLKSDDHMRKIKSRFLQQQQKIATFEEKKQRLENKKFHRAIKDYKQKEKHAAKRQLGEATQDLKKQIRERGGDLDNAEIDKILSKNNGEKQTGGKNEKKKKVIDIVREKHLQSQKTKNSFRPGGRSAGWNNSANNRSGSGNNSRGTGRGGRGGGRGGSSRPPSRASGQQSGGKKTKSRPGKSVRSRGGKR